MKIDLFEFVEGVIRGVVYFLYNLIETIWQIVRYPLKGPVRLYRAHRKTDRRQIGGLTLLFLLFFIFYGLLARGSLDETAPRIARVREMVSTPPSFHSDAAWHAIVGALVATVIVDALLRGFLRWRLKRRIERRQMVLATAEYALAWPAIVALAYPLFADIFFQTHSPEELLGGAVHRSFPFLMFASFFPAATLLARGARRRQTKGAKSGLRYLGRGIGWAVVYVGLMLLLLVAWGVGNDATEALQTVGAQKRRLVPLGVHCDPSAQTPSVEVAFENPTGRAFTVDPYTEFYLFIRTSEEEFIGVAPEPIADEPRVVLFKPGVAETFRFTIPKDVASFAKKPGACIVEDRDGTENLYIDWPSGRWPEELSSMSG